METGAINVCPRWKVITKYKSNAYAPNFLLPQLISFTISVNSAQVFCII